MKISSMLLAIGLFCSVCVNAQPNLQIQGTSPNLYLVHSVVPKENWYSIGRLYNLSPKDLSAYNHVSMDKPLDIGQHLKIPLNTTNFSQDSKKAADEVFVPVYHEVQPKEWMYRISQNYNKVPIEKLQQWNKVSNDDLKPGVNLVVGYLKVKSSQSSLASAPSAVKNKETGARSQEIVEKKSKIEEKKIEDKTADVKIEKPAETKTVANPSVNSDGGFFKTQFGESGRNASGAAGVFRSTSGWQDGKYYALMNNVPVGTIIKVENPSSRKTVYAKVLGSLPDMKESLGLAVRISDAAATELGLGSKSNVEIRY
ncbi:MAG TPA: LysM peptidoglycan-binding domain-containing protein [Chitinophagaceae bacterium]|nr:LysM peptidoglycan-binding domain-containing protein [Chitinophagaceae bacterium]